MKNFQRVLYELQEFCLKNDIPNGLRLSIVCRNDRDKAYFIKGLREELQPQEIELINNQSDLSEFRLYGISVRILS